MKKQDAAMIREWQDDGFVVLPRFYSDADIEAARTAQHKAWVDDGSRVVVDDLDTDQRMRIRDVDEAARGSHRFKVNDLYLESESVRRLALNPRITPILKALLADTPVLCNFVFHYFSEEDSRAIGLRGAGRGRVLGAPAASASA